LRIRLFRLVLGLYKLASRPTSHRTFPSESACLPKLKCITYSVLYVVPKCTKECYYALFWLMITGLCTRNVLYSILLSRDRLLSILQLAILIPGYPSFSLTVRDAKLVEIMAFKTSASLCPDHRRRQIEIEVRVCGASWK